jgi:anaerobic magnesium-protoporphyrin IX monomethyl ester cyclase
MRVTLVNPRKLDTPNHPLGILYIAAILERHGYVVTVIDPDFDASADSVAKTVVRTKPDFVGFGATTPQITQAIETAKIIKRLVPKIPILFGGVHPTILSKKTLKEKCVDYVIIGEGEITTLELCNALAAQASIKDVRGIGYKKGTKMILNKPRELVQNLDSLPFPARHLLPSRFYFAPPRIRGVWTKATATVMASRGCPYRCIYCSSHLMFGRKVRFRSVENVIQEIEELRQQFKIDSVWFADDTFTANPQWVMDFCRALKRLGWMDFKWACQARVNTVSYELLKEMREAGCRQLDFGVESGSPRVLSILKKDITPGKVVEAFDTAKKAGLLRFASFMIGIPGETEEDLKLTETLAIKIKPDYADFLFTVPYPGTELYCLAEQHGGTENLDDYENWILGKQTDRPILHTTISERELIRWRSRLHNRFFVTNYLTFLRDPHFIPGSINIFLGGLDGLQPGLKRFMNTGKIDSIFMQVLRQYRNKMKRLSQM